jgi:hypothetical protein
MIFVKPLRGLAYTILPNKFWIYFGFSFYACTFLVKIYFCGEGPCEVNILTRRGMFLIRSALTSARIFIGPVSFLVRVLFL